MYTIGLNIEKVDSAATLFNNNKIICHIEEERVTRIKKAKGLFPSESLSYCINLIPNKLDTYFSEMAESPRTFTFDQE